MTKSVTKMNRRGNKGLEKSNFYLQAPAFARDYRGLCRRRGGSIFTTILSKFDYGKKNNKLPLSTICTPETYS